MAETAVLTLTDFLLARIAEDESQTGERLYRLSGWSGCAGSAWNQLTHAAQEGWAFAAQRIKAEGEVKRRILELHRHIEPSRANVRTDVGCMTCHWDEEYADVWPEGWCPTLRALALPYADHSDHREEWRP